ncbi:transcriptional protein SWT1 isoform X1 [Hemiscyllium ocellatum]|uniref:transcriptional protein SWT1 isoform X1 n=2 Tax=Hemiscyllium ocellatum TaxID=170820 RepID=UPI0029666647|nr:transcriptional protein SWT1 isoform X1 [Hemiscyllium ocellatum]
MEIRATASHKFVMSRKHSKHKREKTKSSSKKKKSERSSHDEEKNKTELLPHCKGGSLLPQQSSLSCQIGKKRKLVHQRLDGPSSLRLSMEEQSESSWSRLSHLKEKHIIRLEKFKDAPVQDPAFSVATSSSYPEKIKCKSKRKKKHKKRSHEENSREKHQTSTTTKPTYCSTDRTGELSWCKICQCSEFCRHALQHKAVPSTEEEDLKLLEAKASCSSFECLQTGFKDYVSKIYLQEAKEATGNHYAKDRNEYCTINTLHGTSKLTVSSDELREKKIETKEQAKSSELHMKMNYSDLKQNVKESHEVLRNIEELDSSKEKSDMLVKLQEKPSSSGKLFDVWKVTSAPLKPVKNTGNLSEGSKIPESLIWERCNKISNCLRERRKKSKKLEQAGNESSTVRTASCLVKTSGKPSDQSKSTGVENPNVISKEQKSSESFRQNYEQSLRSCNDPERTKLVRERKGESGYPQEHQCEITDSDLTPKSGLFATTDVAVLSPSCEKVEEFGTPKQAKKFNSFKILKKVYATDALSQSNSQKLLTSSAAPSKGQSSDNATKSTPKEQDHVLFAHQPDTQRLNSSTTLPDNVDMDTDQKMEIVEELQTARHEKVLEVELGQSYGELTSMDIDPPQEIKIFSTEATSKSDILLVLDTNIFISHLNFIINIKDHGVAGVGFPIFVIPWVVLQELDSLKNGRLSGGVNRKAIPAVQFIYSCFKSRHPHVWGQSMQQAAQKFCGLREENNDDRVLQCCLQYQQLYPSADVLLCSDDKNLCSKALVSNVKAVRKIDLLTELSDMKSISDVPNTTQDLSAFNQSLSVNSVQELNRSPKQHQPATESALVITSIISQLEKTLGTALSVILETEMKTIYEDLWTEILFVKPPWSLEDLLLCMKKHWIAVFGLIVKRNLQSSVEMLSDYFQAGKRSRLNHFTVTWMLLESQKLIQAFNSRSGYGGILPRTLAVIDELREKISEYCSKNELTSTLPEWSQGSSEKLEIPFAPPLNPDSGRNVTVFPFNCISGCPTSEIDNSQDVNRIQQIWATFENVWNIINKYSSLIFATFNLPHNPLTVVTDSKLPLPEEAFQSLQRLMPAVKELLTGIQRILSTDSNVQDFQKLTEILHIFLNNEETNLSDTRISAQDLHECFSHEEYRKRLTVGSSQLAELSYSLEQCNAALCLEARSRGLV